MSGSRRRRPWWRRKSEQTPRQIFEAHVELIGRIARSAARRAGFGAEDAEDFHSQVNLKLIENDFAVLRKHRGDSSIPTYLTVVINNQLRDFRNSRYGKFRPSATAKKLGRTAIELERLVARDGHPLDGAVRILEGRADIEETEQQLLKLAGQLPTRKPPRRFVSEATLETSEHALSARDSERGLIDRERARTANKTDRVLDLALKTLAPQDLLILKMHYRDGAAISTIAQTLALEQRPLYSRRAKCLAALKQALQAEGLTWDQVREILGWSGTDLQVRFGDVETTDVGDTGSGDTDGEHPDEPSGNAMTDREK